MKHKHYDCIVAWAEGKNIQFKAFSHSEWEDVDMHGEEWYEHYTYRIKPEPQVCCGDYEKCWKACTPRGRWLAEQEIVKSESHIVKWSIPVDPNNFGEPLAQFEQEPVAWMEDSIEFYAKDHPTNSCSIPLYPAPPRKEWVGLTEHEIWECQKPGLSDDVYKLIEAKLREKNT